MLTDVAFPVQRLLVTSKISSYLFSLIAIMAFCHVAFITRDNISDRTRFSAMLCGVAVNSPCLLCSCFHNFCFLLLGNSLQQDSRPGALQNPVTVI